MCVSQCMCVSVHVCLSAYVPVSLLLMWICVCSANHSLWSSRCTLRYSKFQSFFPLNTPSTLKCNSVSKKHGQFPPVFSVYDFVTSASDIILYCAWVLLTIIGLTIHYFLERKNPPFPDGPWRSFQQSRRGAHGSRPSERSELDDDDEHRPLLYTPPRQHPQHAWREQPVERFHQPAGETREWWQDPGDLPGAVVLPVVSDLHTPPPPYAEVDVPPNPVQ